jgi:hypothetical protein
MPEIFRTFSTREQTRALRVCVPVPYSSLPSAVPFLKRLLEALKAADEKSRGPELGQGRTALTAGRGPPARTTSVPDI